MSFLKDLFKKETVECPRCLGKGYVDSNDIKRLGMESAWTPGECAYCGGTGRVDPKTISKVAVNENYLTNELPESERKKVVKGNRRALERAALFNDEESTVANIRELYFNQGYSIDQIADLYVDSMPEWDDEDRNEWLAYISNVVA